MKRAYFIVLLSAYLPLSSCQNEVPQEQEKEPAAAKDQSAAQHEAHWSYEGETGPEHWAEIEKESSCDGQHQSPINIIASETRAGEKGLQTADIHYAPGTQIHDVTNNGHSIQYNFEPGDYVIYRGEKFDLKQFHFHEPAEHLINGVRYPLEIHLVHQNEAGKILVIGIMAEEGENSPTFSFIESFLPVHQGETKPINQPFDFNRIFPDNFSHFEYTGSLTTPPCTEGVHWVVMRTPITVSLSQVKLLQKLMPLHNYRTEQPLNNRVVWSFDNM